jgi:hypothetical protein
MAMNHLLPHVHELMDLSQSERISAIHSDWWIGYGIANRALDILHSLMVHPKRVRMPNLMIIGPTNNGKTMIVEKFKRKHPQSVSSCGQHDIVPIVIMQMPSDPSPGRFYTSLMRAINMPYLNYRVPTAIEQTVLRILGSIDTRILIIDEIHNLLSGSNSKQQEFLNLLRFIGNELRLSIVGVGIKDAYLAIRTDNQLENRFEPLVLPMWSDDVEFARLLASFAQILPLKKPSNLLADEVRQMILEKTEGTIGEISTFLRRAAELAIITENECIDYELLSQVEYLGPQARRRVYESVRI